MRAHPIAWSLALGVLCIACEPKPQPPQSAPASRTAPAAKTAPAPAPASIGSATMTADGTIVLQLRATGPGPAIGDALILYPKGHAKYDEVLKHLGGLKPGEAKPCPPFPD
jgi:hypothetical protein